MHPVRIHVNQPNIRRNKLEGRTDYPVITVAREDRSDICSGVEIVTPDGEVVARMVYRPDAPLDPSGATVWVEIERADVEVRTVHLHCDPEDRAA